MARKWYAVLLDKDDKDWGKGSFSRNEALTMAKRIGGEAYVAVIEALPVPECVDRIYINA